MYRIRAELAISSFISRHSSWVARNIKRTWVMRKAMKKYATEIGKCEFRGCRSKDRFSPQVHHVKRLEDYPELGEDSANFICLCSHHHFSIGHPCSWHEAVDNVREICANAVIQERTDNI